MTRRPAQVKVHLDAGDIKQLPAKDIAIILRGADDLICSGGRNLLVKILKGSKEKKIQELDLDQSPVYGYYQKSPVDQVKAQVDWLIINGYLRLGYSSRLPLLEYTDKGWAIERDTYAQELLELLESYIEQNNYHSNLTFLNDKDRGLIMLLLDKIEHTKNPRYLPLLTHWQANTYQKIAARIKQVKKSIRLI